MMSAPAADGDVRIAVKVESVHALAGAMSGRRKREDASAVENGGGRDEGSDSGSESSDSSAGEEDQDVRV